MLKVKGKKLLLTGMSAVMAVCTFFGFASFQTMAQAEETSANVVNVLDLSNYVIDGAINEAYLGASTLTAVAGKTDTGSGAGTDTMVYWVDDVAGKNALVVGNFTHYKVGMTTKSFLFHTAIDGDVIEKIELEVYANYAADANYTFNNNGGIRLFSTDDTGASAAEGYVIPNVTQGEWVTLTLNADDVSKLLDDEGNLSGIQMGTCIGDGWDRCGFAGTPGGNADWAPIRFGDMNVYTEATEEPEVPDTNENVVDVLDLSNYLVDGAINEAYLGASTLTAVAGKTDTGSGAGTDTMVYWVDDVAGKNALVVGNFTHYKVGMTTKSFLFHTAIAGNTIEKIELEVYANYAADANYTFNNNGGIRLFSTDDTGASAAEGYVIPNVAQGEWVTLTLNADDIAKLLDNNGNLSGIQMGTCIGDGWDRCGFAGTPGGNADWAPIRFGAMKVYTIAAEEPEVPEEPALPENVVNVLDLSNYLVDGAINEAYLGASTLTAVDGKTDTGSGSGTDTMVYWVDDVAGKNALVVGNFTHYKVGMTTKSFLFHTAIAGNTIEKIELEVYADHAADANYTFNNNGGIRLFSKDATGASGQGYVIPNVEQRQWITITIDNPADIAKLLDSEGNLSGIQMGTCIADGWDKCGFAGAVGGGDWSPIRFGAMNVYTKEVEEPEEKPFEIGDTVNILDLNKYTNIDGSLLDMYLGEKSLTAVAGKTDTGAGTGIDTIVPWIEEIGEKSALTFGYFSHHYICVTMNSFNFYMSIAGKNITKIEIELYADWAADANYTFNENGGIRLYAADANGQSAADGYMIPNVAQREWVTLVIEDWATLSKLLDSEGNFSGLQIGTSIGKDWGKYGFVGTNGGSLDYAAVRIGAINVYTAEHTTHTEEKIPAVAPTCTATGLTAGVKCLVCGEILTAQEEVPATGHTEETIPAAEPTCTATGLTAGVKCSVCQEILTAQEEVPANGHTKETIPAVPPTCTATGLTAGVKCSVCQEILTAQEEVPATGHTESDWIVDKEAEVGVAGSQHKECTVCGESLATEEIPALPDDSTSDDTSSDTTSDSSTSDSNSTEKPVAFGCAGSVGGVSAVMVLIGIGAFAFLRKKED